MKKRTSGKSALCLVLALAFIITLLPGAALAAPAESAAVNYDRNGALIDGDNLPGVYAVKAQKGDRALTMGIPSVAKGNLENGPTTESPAIITAAAVPYEVKTGAAEFTPIPGGSLYAPYSYFRYKIIEEANPNGAGGTHKKMSGYDGTYYILRVDVSDLIANAPEGSYLHVKQNGNKALLVAIGQTLGEGSAFFIDSTGSKAGAYSLDNAAAALKDKDGFDTETPYIDVILISSGTVIAGADTGSTDPTIPTADVGLSFYVDQVGDYDPSLVYDPAAPAPTDPNAPTHEQLMMKKYYDESKVTADDITSYTVKGSDLEIEVKVEDTDAEPEFWSLRKAMAWQDYNGVPIKLICEVPVLEGLTVEGTDAASRHVVLDVNSFDIQVANHQSTNAAAITVSNATFEISDRSNTTGAELAVGNNANMLIKSGGKLVIDETCQLEIEYDAASTTAAEGETAPKTPDLKNGIIVIEDGGEIENNGIITIEGTEGKPIDPAMPAQRDVQDAVMNILPGATLTNNGCLLINGALYNLGTIVNNGRYSDVIKSTDPDKGNYTYHKGIQLSWKDDVTQNTTTMGTLAIGMDENGGTDSAAGAKLVNTGDIVLIPGYLDIYGQMENSGTLYICATDEAIIPVLPTPDKPTVTEKRVNLGSPVPSYFSISDGAYFTNTGTVTAARAEIVNNGRTGALSLDVPEKFLSRLNLFIAGDAENAGSIKVNEVNLYGNMTNSGKVEDKVILCADDETSGVFENSSADKAEKVYNGAKTVVGDTDVWRYGGDPTLTVTPAEQSVKSGDVIKWNVTASSSMPGRDVTYLIHISEMNPYKEIAQVTIDADTPTEIASVIAPFKNARVLYTLSIDGTNGDSAESAAVTVESSDMTAPASVEGLEYNGKPQTLITSGSIQGEGKILYKLGDSPDYSDTLPTATDAGIYAVYYMLEGDPSTEMCTYTTIAKKHAEISADDVSSAVGAPLGELTYTVSGAVGSDTLGDVSLTTDADAETAGTYTVTAEITNANENYDVTVNNGAYTVSENEFAVTAKDKHGVYSDEATYKGFNIEVTAPQGAKTYYSTATPLTSENYTTAGLETLVNLPAGAGTHTVYYYVTDGTNAVSGQKHVIIDKAEQAAPTNLSTAPETVKGSADGRITGLKPREAEYRPAGNNGSYAMAYDESVFVPAGTYLVRKPGDENHFASPDASVTVSQGPAITVTFDSNGGSAVASVGGLAFGDLVAQPQPPILDGYTFAGWMLGDKRFDFSTPVTYDITLTAAWNKKSSGGGGGGGGGGGSSSSSASTVTLPQASEGGTVSSDRASAKTGETVTLTVKTNPGYTLKGISVTDQSGSAVPVFENPDGTYTFKMPSTDVKVAPVFEKEGSADAGKYGAFTDLGADAWYKDGVDWCLENGLMNGVSGDLFAPNSDTSRAMIVTMLWRMEGQPEGGENVFADVPAQSWYTGAVSWAASNGIVNGISESEFAPDTPITREQLAAILYRYAQTKDQGFKGAWMFRLENPDAGDISEYAYEPMCWMVMNEVISGMDDGSLAPAQSATRAQVATMMMRFCTKLAG
ncbi:MAG: S-layer homology domain-containing protein [Clostridia bacterium]|nr:S-layer homology domain-containing protein [Clostridia bacterium]